MYFEYTIAMTLLVGLAHIVLLGYPLINRKISRRAATPLKLYLILASCYHILSYLLLNNPDLASLATIWSHLQLLLLIASSIALWYFSQAFFMVSPRKRGFIWLSLIPFGVMLWLEFARPFTKNITLPFLVPNYSQISVTPTQFMYWVGVSIISLILISAIVTAVKLQRQTNSPRHRNRFQFLILSLSIVIIGLALSLPANPLINIIGLVFHWFGSLSLIYIAYKRNLPDINTNLRKSAVIVAVLLMTLAFYGLVTFGLQTILKQLGASTEIILISVAASLLTLLYIPLQKAAKILTELVLFRRSYKNEQIIRRYIQALDNITLVDELVSASLTFIAQQLDIKEGAFLMPHSEDETRITLKILPDTKIGLSETIEFKKDTRLTRHLIDQGQSLAQYTIDVIPDFVIDDEVGVNALKATGFEQYIPIWRNKTFLGIIALGSFASGAPYSVQDEELLVTLATQTAIALENAHLFDNTHQTLAEITQMKNLMLDVFASIHSGVITLSTTDQILMINQAAYQILNLPKTIQPGSSMAELLSHLKATALPALLRDVKTTQRGYYDYEIRGNIPGRGPVSLIVDLTPLRNGEDHTEGITLVISDLTERQQLKAVQDMFRTYLSPAVVDRLPTNPTELKLGGQRQEVSVLFADIRGFTTYSENQEPEDLITVLNQHLSIAVDAILEFEGTLDKFMGDAIMAIFNAPLAQADHPHRAVKAAAKMQQALNAYHTQLGKNAPQLKFGVGIHVGEAVVGNVGTRTRMDYTTIGDAVNLAKRIQENAPGGKILLSQQTYDRVKNQVHAMPYKFMTLKGREEQEQTYELLDIVKAPAEKKDVKDVVEILPAMTSLSHYDYVPG